MSEPMIKIENVSKWYGPVQVLHDCTVHINKGDVAVVCGPSGSGKSTLIKTVNGLEPVQKGPSPWMARKSPTPKQICPGCAAGWAWCSSISSCSRIWT